METVEKLTFETIDKTFYRVNYLIGGAVEHSYTHEKLSMVKHIANKRMADGDSIVGIEKVTVKQIA